MFGIGHGIGLQNFGESVPTNSFWQSVKDVATDVPVRFDGPTNTLVQGLDDMGMMSEAGAYLIICVPSVLDSTYCLIDVVSGTVIGNYNINGGINVNQSLYRTFGANDGYRFNNAWIDTKYNPATSITLNDHCVFWVSYDDEVAPGGSDYNWGALNTTSQFIGATNINNAGNARSFAYTTTRVAQGAAGAGDAGIYISNKNASNYLETVINGAVPGTDVGTAGSLPTRDIWLNTFNNNNAPSTFRNQSILCAWGSFGRGLSTGERDTLNTLLTTWQNTLKRKRSLKTKQVVWDGNSFNTFWFSALQRATQFLGFSDGAIHWDTEAISGKEIRDMDANYATDVATKYDGTLTNNYLIVNETVNDLTNNNNLAATKAFFDSYITKAKATGWNKILVMGGPVRKWQIGFAIPDQATLDLELDDLMQYMRDQAPIQGYTWVEPPANIWVWRADYASDAEYHTATGVIYNNPAIVELNFTHPVEIVCRDDWAPGIWNEVNGI